MHFNPYGGAAVELAVRLVNAAPDQDLARQLIESDYRPFVPVDPRQDAELRRWIRELDAVFSNPSVESLNALLAKTTSRPYISTHDDRDPHLHFSQETAPIDERVKAYTAIGLATLFCEAPSRIGRCARETCEIVFVDTSRNGKRRFCSTRCATQVHVADHRRRVS